jgi:hypothetical protein
LKLISKLIALIRIVFTVENIDSSYSVQITSLQSQVTFLNDSNQTYSNNIANLNNQIQTTNDKLQLYQDTFASSVTSGESPRANRQTYDLVNNPNSSNPTWDQLKNFIISDQTDKKPYISNVYVCTDYARDVHNNAEKAGIKAGFVGIDFKNQLIGHACNVFKTVDLGLVFIDCTGLKMEQEGPNNRDTVVIVKLKEHYVPQSLVREIWWNDTWDDMGIVQDIQIYW